MPCWNIEVYKTLDLTRQRSVYQTRPSIPGQWRVYSSQTTRRIILSNQIDESTLRTQLRSILDVPAGASRRQLRRARDREVQRCRDDMLSSDQRLNSLAKKRLEELDRAFEYLTEPKKFRDFLELVNDKLLLGTMDSNSLAATIARREGLESEPQQIDSQQMSGPEGAAEPAHTLAEEREVLNELRRKRLEKAPKIGQKRRQQMEKLIKDTHTAIETGAASTARSKASELVARGVTDPDEFYERVYSSALEVAQAARDRALQTIEEKNLPIDEKLIDEWESAVLDRSEQAAEREYNNLEGVMAAEKVSTPSGPKFMFKLAIVLCTIAGTLIIFCNVNTVVTSNQPDAVQQQIKNAGGTDTTSSGTLELLKKIPMTVSTNKAIATAEGMSGAAGSAGTAGGAVSLGMDGAADYNAGCAAIKSGAYGDATLFFNKAIEKNPNIYQFFYNRGLAYLYLGHYRSALSDFASSFNLRTDMMQARYNQGIIYLAGGADCIARADRGSATEKEALLKQGVVNLRAAISEFSVVTDKMPKLAQPVYNRGIARYRLGDLDGAISDFETAVRNDPNMESAARNLEVAKTAKTDPKTRQPLPHGTIPGAPIGPQGPPAPGFF